MIILKSWLKDYIDIPWSDEELVRRLTDAGSLVDSYLSTIDENIVIAKILEVKSHPNADRLRLAKVSDGSEEYSVVCGAPNIEPGQIVPLAKIGAKIGETYIKATEIRGESSSGMLCSERELGLGDDHEGIMILPAESKVGQPLASQYDVDMIMDLEITPNRGDCLSHLGIAREISSLTGDGIAKEPMALPMSSVNVSSELSVEVSDPKLCPRYFARKIKNVKIASSPDWLQKRLSSVGLKPINNVVDITNYIMMDLGQPLHAFDASKVSGGSIVVRRAQKGESIKTIDERIIDLETSALLIADSSKPLAIAGVMGGHESQITDNTTEIILEAAEFDRVSIRRTSKIHHINSDAAYRYERGIDPSLVEYALNKAAKMVKELAGGTIMQGIVKSDTPLPETSVEFDYARINKLLGTSLGLEDIRRVLKYRGFRVENNTAFVPSWRHDVRLWQDLAEEVMCIHGLDNIKLKPVPKSPAPKKSAYYYKEHIKDILVGCGFSEVYNYSFMSEVDAIAAGLKTSELLEVANPVSPEIKYMRNSLVPGMITTVAKNPTFDPVLIFEVGNVFDKCGEYSHLCVMASGNGAEKVLQKTSEELKRIIGNIDTSVATLTREDLKPYKVKKPSVHYLNISLESIAKKMKIDESKLSIKLSKKEITYRPVSKYPSVTRDLAFIVSGKVAADDVEREIYAISELINRVELFDEFASDTFGAGKKNLAFHIFLQAEDRTLKDDEADDIVRLIVETLGRKHKAKLRDK